MVETIEIVRKLVDAEVEEYATTCGHGILTEAERDAWRADLRSRLDYAQGKAWLEVGAGTGVFTHLLMELISPDNSVVALDISKDSLLKNERSLPSEYRDRVKYLVGDAHNEKLFDGTESGDFDYIVCRQSVVLFHDPQKVFRNWKKLLKSGGKVYIIDGLWSRDAWTGDWAKLVDLLPLSCPRSLTDVSDLLSETGLEVEQAQLLTGVNQCLNSMSTDDCPRFIIIARKTGRQID